jgi:predicted aspartyl protease
MERARRSRSWPSACALLLLSCGSAPPAGPTTPRDPLLTPPVSAKGDAGVEGSEAGPESPPAQKREVKLRYELAGRAFPLPLVHGTIGGESTWMLVDTGANSHVIAGWLARKAKLDAKNLGDQGTDHAGRTIITSRVERSSITIDEWGALPDSPTLVTEVPEAVARLGIGAFLSPQQLGAGQALVLDLAESEMRVTESALAMGALSGRGADPFGDPVHVCEDNDSPIRGLAFVVQAKIEGAKVGLLLDTGAHHSDLLAGSSAGRRLAPRSVSNREQVYAASGKISTRTVRGAKVNVGSHKAVVDVDIIPGETDTSCPRDGVLAMDILKSCVLVFDRTAVHGRCAR